MLRVILRIVRVSAEPAKIQTVNDMKSTKFGRMIARSWVVNPESKPYIMPKKDYARSELSEAEKEGAVMAIPETQEFDIEYFSKRDCQPGPQRVFQTLRFDGKTGKLLENEIDEDFQPTPFLCDHVPRPAWLYEQHEIMEDAKAKGIPPLFGKVMKWQVCAINDDEVDQEHIQSTSSS